jgi:hypothetical protein
MLLKEISRAGGFFMKSIRNDGAINARKFWRYRGLISLALLRLCQPSIALADPASEAEQCRQNLIRISHAIQEYRRGHLRLPDRLRELVPDYLPRADLLVCPASKQAGEKASVDVNTDGMTTGSYLYEFESRPMTNGLAQGLGMTLRNWRQLQMGRVGGDLPMVRCTNHSPALNLSFGGKIYETSGDWEDRFSSLVEAHDLRLETLLAENVS